MSGLRWDVGFGVYGPGSQSAGYPDLTGTLDRLRERVFSGVRHWGPSEGDPAATYSGLSRFATGTFKQSSWTYKLNKFDERRWSESLAGFPVRYDQVSVDVNPWSVQLVCDPYERETACTAIARGVHGHRGWVPRLGASQMAPVVGDLFDELVVAASVPGVQTGFVNFDNTADPFGSLLRDDLHLDRFEHDRWVRGYYWALLLTGGHVERLGGEQRFIRTSPCEDIVTVDQAGEPVWLCRLTNDPLELTSARMQEWREALEPVLPEIYLSAQDDRSRFWFETDVAVWTPSLSLLMRTDIKTPFLGGPSLEWSGTPRDPEEPTVFIYPGPGFDRDADTGTVAALARVWSLYGKAGRLAEKDLVTGVDNADRATIIGISPITWDSDDDYNDVLTFTVRFGPGNPTPLLERLVQAVPGWRHESGSAEHPPCLVPTIDIAKITIT